MNRPSADMPGMNRPSTDMSGMNRPSADMPGMNRSSTDMSGINRSSAGMPGMNRPSADIGMNRPSAGMPGMNRPNAARPGMNRPNAGRPGMNRTNAGRPSVNMPDRPMNCMRENGGCCENQLACTMSSLWEQHVFWTRLYLISAAEGLEDIEYNKARLLKNQKDIADIFRMYYGNEKGDKIEKLLTEHIAIGGDFIEALKNNETEKSVELDTKWHQNADNLAKELNNINAYYDLEEIQQMLYNHLALTTEEITNRLNKDYEADIEAMDNVEKDALIMASYFADGLQRDLADMINGSRRMY
jgi:hypothetical protein